MIFKSHLGPEFNIINDQFFKILFPIVVRSDPRGQETGERTE